MSTQQSRSRLGIRRVEAFGVNWARFQKAKRKAFPQPFIPSYEVIGQIINWWSDSVLEESDQKAA
jgi:hypothetical protein